MVPKVAACVHALRGGRAARPHPQRHRAARAAARGLHRRGRRHDDRRPTARGGVSDGRARSTQRVALDADVHHADVRAASRCMFVRGEGMRLYDDDGREYLDFVSRHRRGQPRPRAPGGHRGASPSRRRKLVHVSNLFYVEHRAELARDVVRAARRRHGRCSSPTPAPRRSRARSSSRAGGRGEHKPGAYKVVTARALASTAARSRRSPPPGRPSKQEAFAPLPEGFVHVPAQRHRGARGGGRRARSRRCCSRSSRARAACGRSTAEYLAAARRICDERGALLIARRGADGLLPHRARLRAPGVRRHARRGDASPRRSPTGCRSAAFVARDEVAAALEPGDHGSTFGGGPVVCAAGRATIAALVAERSRRERR